MKELFAVLNINPSYLPFLFILVLIGFVLYKAHRDKSESFNIYHLVVNSKTNRGSLEKVLMLTAGTAITWWFIDRVAIGKASWEDAAAYGTLMGLAKVANDMINSKTPTTDIPKSPSEE
jgi:hypothetical protein